MRIAPTLRTSILPSLRQRTVRHSSTQASTIQSLRVSRALARPLSPVKVTATARVRQARLLHVSARIMSGNPPAAAETDTVAAQNAEEMAITPESISKTLEERIGATYCAVEDMSGGCGQAFEAHIVSPQFEKKTTLARHRLVNGALRQEIAAIHAWTPKCFTPDEWAKKQGGS